MNHVMRLLYADKRNWRWEMYGPGKDWGKKYGSIVREKIGADGKLRKIEVNARAMYPAFIGEQAPRVVPSTLSAVARQTLVEKIGVVWENMLSRSPKIPKPAGHLPHFRPVARYSHSAVRATLDRGIITLTIPVAEGKRVEVRLDSSKDHGWEKWVAPLRAAVLAQKGFSVEFHEQNGMWYAHIPVAVATPTPPRKPRAIMGIHQGINAVSTAAVIATEDRIARVDGTPVWRSPLTHRLERVHARMRGLRRAKDRGGRETRRAWKRLKGKRTRQQKELMRQVAVGLVDFAEGTGVEGLAMADLRGMGAPRSSKRLNRLMSSWQRGEGRDFLAFKTEERGLAFAEVRSKGVKSTCPGCGRGEKKTRRGRAGEKGSFRCRGCGYTDLEEVVAAQNLALRAWKGWHGEEWSGEISRSSPGGGSTGQDSVRRISAAGIGEPRSPHRSTSKSGIPPPARASPDGNPENGTIGATGARREPPCGEPPLPGGPGVNVERPSKHPTAKRTTSDDSSGEVMTGSQGPARIDGKSPGLPVGVTASVDRAGRPLEKAGDSPTSGGGRGRDG